MRSARPLALIAVLSLVLAACGGDTGGSDTTEAAPDTTAAPGTTAATDTTMAAPDTTEGEMMDLAFDFGFDEATGTISLGALAAISGPIPDIGASVLHGHQVYWERVNANGGVAGTYPVEIVERDNEYNSEVNRVVYSEIKDDVLGISSSLGTPSTASIQEESATDGIVVGAGTLASQWALTENIILNLASNTYFAQFANAPYWATEVADPAVITDASVIGLIYQADDYGQDCLNGLNFGLENTGLTLAYEATYAVGDEDFSAQVGGAQAGGVDVLFVCATPSVLAGILGTAAAIEFSPTVLGSSPSYNPVLPAALGGGDEEAGLGLFSSFPYYGLGAGPQFEDDTPGMTALRDDLETYGPNIPVPDEEVNAFFFFGYSQAQTFHEVLEVAVANGDITRAGILEAIPQLQNVDMGFGGAPGGYGPTPLDRIPSNEDNIGIPVSITETRFGLQDVSGFYEAPYMSDWDPAG
jgi:ABC-type branched-subunit amino acid transport system substrate-binding protein